MKFNVLVSGTPPLTINWFRNRREILSGVDCSIQKDDSSSSLELFFTKPTDSGDYTCEISNDVGSDSCQTTLFVKGFTPFYFYLGMHQCHFFLLIDSYTEISNSVIIMQSGKSLSILFSFVFVGYWFVLMIINSW